MLQATTLQFLKDLKKNNNKEWFEKNRKQYETAKADFLLLTTNVLAELSKIDPAIAHLEPKKCVFRINRDVRFSKDKSPYKSNMGLYIAKTGKNGVSAGYYLHVEPESCFIGGGLYGPNADFIQKVRQEIDYHWKEFSGILKTKKFLSVYDGLNMNKEYSLTRPPKGYEADNIAIEFIKLKSWIATTTITDEELMDKKLIKKIITDFHALQPLINFLNRAIEV